MRITHDLCQTLQRKSQDILNSISLVSTTKALLQEMRQTGWNDLIKEVIIFCEKHNITIIIELMCFMLLLTPNGKRLIIGLMTT